MTDDFTLKRVAKALGDAGCKVGVHVLLEQDHNGVSFFEPDGRPVARLLKHGKTAWEACWWSHRDKWDHIGDFGGEIFEDLDEAVTYVLEDPMGIFW